MIKLLDIPVIGYVLRWCNAVVKLPIKLEKLFSRTQAMQGEMVAIEKREAESRTFHIEKLQAQIKELDTLLQTNKEESAELKQQILEVTSLKHDIYVLQGQLQELLQQRAQSSEAIKNCTESLQQQLLEHFSILQEHQKTLDQSVTDIVNLRNGFLEKMIRDTKQLENLNRELSIHKTIWGDEAKLHISTLASVSSCFFNTNSGEITIGDYTFSGSGVSILAGSHDMRLSGLMRREYELKEQCDIEIGSGVWLASNSTILGPCKIGDNAVIAAGAVVIPGTIIPENTVYAGIPAKKVKNIDCDNSILGEPFQEALKRTEGVIFYDGWSEHLILEFEKEMLKGHWLTKTSGIIYSSKKYCKVYCYVESCDGQNVTVKCNGKIVNRITEQRKIIELQFEKKLNEICIEKSESKGRVFIAIQE